jgi:hypothetical protein
MSSSASVVVAVEHFGNTPEVLVVSIFLTTPIRGPLW